MAAGFWRRALDCAVFGFLSGLGAGALIEVLT